MLAAGRLLFLALLVSAAPAVAAQAGAGRLRISASPAALRLAEGSRATLRVAAYGEPPVLAASIGRIDSLREVSSGVYEAEYVPPDSLDPQIAFVTALSPGGFGWVPIALFGVREVVVSARHGTPVSVSVEDDVFGPVPADGMGRAVVRVAVPPGARTARYGTQRISLGVPEKSLVHVLLSTTSVNANSSAEVIVRAFAVTDRARPLAGAPLALAASEGTLSPPVEIEPGVFQARWKVDRGAVRQSTVTARIAGKPSSVDIATLERVPGPPHSLAIELDRDQLVAGEGDVLGVTARVLDVAGNPTESAMNVIARPGAVLEWERTGRGRYTGRVQVPKRRTGRQDLEVKVVAAGPLVATRTVPLLPGPARQVKVEAENGLYADGRSHELRISLLDQEGNRVDVKGPVAVVAVRGSVGEPTRHAPGSFRLEYRASLATEDFDDLVVARAGPLEGEARLRVRARGGAVVFAPKVGFTLGRGTLRSPSAGAELGFWTRSLGQGFGLVLDGQVFTFRRTDTVQGISLESSATFVALEASLAWRRPLAGWMLWLGAGGGAVNVSSKVSGIAGQADLSGGSWVPAAHASLGWGRPLGPGIPYGEVRLAWQADPGRGPVRGSLESLTFNLGYRLDVF